MYLSTFAAVVWCLLLPTFSVAIPTTRSDLVVHEKRHATPREWVKRSRLSSKTMLPVRIALSQKNLEKGHEFLMDV